MRAVLIFLSKENYNNDCYIEEEQYFIRYTFSLESSYCILKRDISKNTPRKKI